MNVLIFTCSKRDSRYGRNCCPATKQQRTLQIKRWTLGADVSCLLMSCTVWVILQTGDIDFRLSHTIGAQIRLFLNFRNLRFYVTKYSNITSFFRFVDKRAIYRLGIISLAHAPIHATDFSVINVHVDELSSARIWQHKLCATFSANVNINYRLPIKIYYRICTLSSG